MIIDSGDAVALCGPPSTSSAEGDPTLAQKVAALLRAQTYPVAPATLDAIETHMSWLIRTDQHVYKLKKPVRSKDLDFSTLAARHRCCVDELRLNRRLAGSVYLDVVTLVVDERGELKLADVGRAVEWLVKMQRLPEQRTLDHLIAAGTANPETIRAIGDKLAHFYANEPAVALNASRKYRALLADLRHTWQILAQPRYGLAADLIRPPAAAALSLSHRLRRLIEARISAGSFVEAHGDLRPEHVFLLSPEPVIIDCLEFNRALRILDPADDLGFLALECERMGLPWAESILFEAYAQISGDRPAPALIHFYQAYRAAVRAKLAIWHLDEARFRDSPKWRRRALDYITLAASHARRGAAAI